MIRYVEFESNRIFYDVPLFFGKGGDVPFQRFRLNYFDIDAERQNKSAQP